MTTPTRPTLDWLEERLCVWVRRLGLQAWSIDLEVGGLDCETSYMEVAHIANYERAIIHVQPWMIGDGEGPSGVLGRTPGHELVEQSLVHELLHLYTRGLVDVVDSDLNGLLHRDVHDQISHAAARVDEQIVDRLATALVSAFSAAPWSAPLNGDGGGGAPPTASDEVRGGGTAGGESLAPCTGSQFPGAGSAATRRRADESALEHNARVLAGPPTASDDFRGCVQ